MIKNMIKKKIKEAIREVIEELNKADKELKVETNRTLKGETEVSAVFKFKF